MKGYVFPGQGAQYVGMGLELYNSNALAKKLFDDANDILGFNITDVMFRGTDEELKQTKITQPAIFLDSVIQALCNADIAENSNIIGAVAGHSLGEFSALVVAKALSFESGLTLVAKRAMAMQKACEITPSTMAAVTGLLDDVLIEDTCKEVMTETGEVVVAANFNCPGQVVISGSIKGVELAGEALKAKGAKRVIVLNVSGGFHSPMMQPAADELVLAINNTEFFTPICPIFQNVDAKPHTNSDEIKHNLINQLTAPVRWTQTVKNMREFGISEFIEYGPGDVLTKLIARI
ncbi:malonyl CoA-acyl carrier protein transacylase [Bacteroidia bacterium]|nr:malonyl CoA-acyl carrier protein transacylase [Bacteroidia bacterium]